MMNINEYVNEIIKEVSKIKNAFVILSSSNPNICSLLALKQSNYPVVYSIDGDARSAEITKHVAELKSIYPTSFQDAARFAKSVGLLGIYCKSSTNPIVYPYPFIRYL